MKILMLLNAAAGSVAQGVESRLKDGFARHGVEATVRAVAGADIAGQAHDFAASRGFDALVVGGGDGSISAAAGALAGTDAVLGIVPLGTLNHFAKDLGIPLDIEGAVGMIAAGASRRVDVAELNGRVFVNNSSVGLYPLMVARRNADQRRFGRTKLLATVPAALRALTSRGWRRLTIAATGERKSVRTPCVFVGNNPYQLDLAAFGTRKSLDRGELCVHVVRQQTRLGVLLLPFKVALGFVDPSRDIEGFAAPAVEIGSHHRRLRVALDGELAMIETPLRYRCRPRSLCVLAPPPVPEAP